MFCFFIDASFRNCQTVPFWSFFRKENKNYRTTFFPEFVSEHPPPLLAPTGLISDKNCSKIGKERRERETSQATKKRDYGSCLLQNERFGKLITLLLLLLFLLLSSLSSLDVGVQMREYAYMYMLIGSNYDRDGRCVPNFSKKCEFSVVFVQPGEISFPQPFFPFSFFPSFSNCKLQHNNTLR